MSEPEQHFDGFPTYESETRCPHCGTIQGLATQVVGKNVGGPTPGQYAFCFSCGEWAVFTKKLQLRKPTKVEVREIAANDKYTKIRDAWEQVQDDG